MACNKDHTKTNPLIEDLPSGQEGKGRHKCASCAYEEGYKHGLNKTENLTVGQVLQELEESQKKEVRHRSPHAAYAKGYLDGVVASYN